MRRLLPFVLLPGYLRDAAALAQKCVALSRECSSARVALTSRESLRREFSITGC